ncbi:Uncharacterised protein [Dermatophilus congolensis]|uniref:Uncharacterized protein n=1 Tax=Dermatophilus congolensis TaxID=1863 RepID=A0AA46H1A7_9MICO|nr:Uncharacterised protein [Dermatophilus congolensis]
MEQAYEGKSGGAAVEDGGGCGCSAGDGGDVESDEDGKEGIGACVDEESADEDP